MAKPKPLGTINGYVNSVFKMGRKKLSFDGTTKGLAEVAIANGAKDGQKLTCNYGGTNYDYCDITMVVSNGWANRIW